VKAEYVNRAEDYRYSSAIDYAGGKGLLKLGVMRSFSRIANPLGGTVRPAWVGI